jgi:hypothetical protein
MIRYESFVETTGARASSSPHAIPPLLSALGGAAGGTAPA